MKGFDWSDLGPDDVEELLAALIIEMHPGATRMDGAGGDGGRDVIWETGPKGLEIFEIKSFRDRLTKKQKGKVEASLAKGLSHEPVRWHLVLPLNHAPSEHRWFNTLRKTTTVPLTWVGKTTIENELAKRPHLVRGYVQSVRETALEAVAAYGAEKALLAGGADDLTARIRGLQDRASESDPDFDFTFASESGKTSIGVRARTADALLRRPIKGVFKLKAPADGDKAGAEALEAFRRCLDYGTPAELPASVVSGVALDAPFGMGFSYSDEAGGDGPADGFTGVPTIQVGPVASDINWAAPGRIKVLGPGGKVLHSTPIEWRGRNSGAVGGELRGQDRLGRFRFTLRHDWPVEGEPPPSMKLNVTFSPTSDVTPAEMLGAIEWAGDLGAPNHLEFEISGEHVLSTGGGEAGGLRPDGLADVIEDLACIEAATTTFNLPEEMDADELAAVFEAARLIRERTYHAEFTDVSMRLEVPSAEEFFERMPPEEDRAIGFTDTLDLGFLVPGMRVQRFITVDGRPHQSREEIEAMVAATGLVDLSVKTIPGTGRVTLRGLEPRADAA